MTDMFLNDVEVELTDTGGSDGAMSIALLGSFTLGESDLWYFGK